MLRGKIDYSLTSPSYQSVKNKLWYRFRTFNAEKHILLTHHSHCDMQ